MTKAITMFVFLCAFNIQRNAYLKTKSWANKMISCIFIGNYHWTWDFAACASIGVKIMTLSSALVLQHHDWIWAGKSVGTSQCSIVQEASKWAVWEHCVFRSANLCQAVRQHPDIFKYVTGTRWEVCKPHNLSCASESWEVRYGFGEEKTTVFH